ncbi:hypothetical protein [Parachlamydia acanthamoebae]|uniref:hypothetical protein n=1 Tax=Parachlamydia acanthamoebae TaxID=83552 RepID=UPI001D0592D6|nr:hypothetical protein [Parachlamydia acanthamoebae]
MSSNIKNNLNFRREFMYDVTLVHAPAPINRTSGWETVRRTATETIKVIIAVAAGSFAGIGSAAGSLYGCGIATFFITNGSNLMLAGPATAIHSIAYNTIIGGLMTTAYTVPLVLGSVVAFKVGKEVYNSF